MGCWQPVPKDKSLTTVEEKIIQAIKLNSPRRLEGLIQFHLSTSTIDIFDRILLSESGQLINALGLCALLGSSEMFEMLLKYKCDLKIMEEFLNKAEISLIEVICTNGYLEILKNYFPFYLSQNTLIKDDLNNSSGCKVSILLPCSPIQIATKNGQIKIVEFFTKYFKKENLPAEFDINSVDQDTGENCAFLACREGQYELVRFLHEKCGAEFLRLNNLKENCLMVTVSSMATKMTNSYVDIAEYLVETVGISVLYCYEFLLRNSQIPYLVEYFEKKLAENDLKVSKSLIETCSPKETIHQPLDIIFTSSVIGSIKGFDGSLPSSIYSIPVLEEPENSLNTILGHFSN